MKKCITLWFSLVVGISMWSQTYHEQLSQIAEDENLVGMSVLVMCDGQIADQFHYGKRDLVRDLDVDENTQYRIASISKSVTAAAMMHVWQEGGFDLDDDVSDAFGEDVKNPNFPEIPITYRMLLSHTSSLQDGSGYSDFLSATYSLPSTPNIKNLILPGQPYYTSDMWRTESPGSYFQYSNINFGLLATLLEKITGVRFDVYVKTHILDPLEIVGSFNVDDLPYIDNVAVLYRNQIPQADNYQGVYPPPFDPGTYAIGYNGLRFGPQGGLRVSAEDLHKFMSMLAAQGEFNGTVVLQPATVSVMQTVEWTFNGTNGNNYYNLFNEWCLGLQKTTNTALGDIVLPAYEMLGHAGEAYGLISDMYFAPSGEIGVIFLTNGYFGPSNYSFGENSAFYSPEERVFDAIQDQFAGNCVVHTEDIEAIAEPWYYSSTTHELIWLNPELPARIAIYDSFGRLITHMDAGNTDWQLSHLPNGIYTAVAQFQGSAAVLRFIHER